MGSVVRTNRNNSIEVGKALAALCVILVHFRFPGIVGKIHFGYARFVIPFFFMVAGYYVYNSDSAKVIKRLPGKIKHIFIIWMLTDVGYTIFDLIYSGFDYKYVIEGLKMNGLDIFRLVFLQYTRYFFAWYLLAQILCYLVTFLIAKYNFWNKTFILIPILLFINIGMGEGLPFILGEACPWYWCSNFWLMGFPCYAFGYYIRINENRLIGSVTKKRVLIAIIVSFFINMAERALTHADQLFFSNIIMAYAIFMFCLKYPDFFNIEDGIKGKFCKVAIFYGNNCLFLYLIHPAIAQIAGGLKGTEFVMENGWMLWVLPIVVVVVTFTIVGVIGKIRNMRGAV